MSSSSDINIPSRPGKKTDFWGSKPKIIISPEMLAAMNGAPTLGAAPSRIITFPVAKEVVAANVVIGGDVALSGARSEEPKPQAVEGSEAFAHIAARRLYLCLDDEAFAHITEWCKCQALDLLTAYHRAAQGIENAKFVVMCSAPATHGDDKKPVIYHFRIGADLDLMASEAAVRGQHQNIYFDPGLRRSDLKKGQRGKLTDIVAQLSLVLEQDASDNPPKLLTLPPGIVPSFIVETSCDPSRDPPQNMHVHFLYDRLVGPQEAQELAELAYRKCGGDVGGKDIAHCWRLPGTRNHPNQKKLAGGRSPEPQPVRIIGGSGKPISVAALRATLEAMPDVQPSRRPRKSKLNSGAQQPHLDLNDEDVDRNAVLDRIDELLRIQIDLEGVDRSVHCARTLFNLFHSGLSPKEVLAVAKGSAFARKFDERGDLVEEVERAYERWHDGMNAPRSPPKSPPKPPSKENEAGANGKPKAKNGPFLDAQGVAINCAPHVEPKFEPDEETEAKAPPPSPQPGDDIPDDDTQDSAFAAIDRTIAIRELGRMNRKYALIRSYLGKTMVLHEGRDEKGNPQEYWHIINEFHNGVAANEGYIEVDNPQTNKTKWMAVSKWWITRKKRREYQSVVFDPSTSSSVRGHYNLWSGFGVVPEPGKWPLMYDHIGQVLCNGDEHFFAYALRWLAWCAQNPHLQAEVGLVFRGAKGTGKGVLGEAMIRIFGFRHSLHLSNPTQLAGKFTGHFEQCVFVFADESIWAGSKLEEQQLKALVTNPTYALEKKFKDAKLAVNRLKFLMGSNSGWVVPSSDGHERRWAVQDVSKEYIGNRAYFDALHKELYKQGGLEAMLSSFLNADLKGWHPRNDVPDTAALREQAMLSLASQEKWLWGLLWAGKLPYHLISKPNAMRTENEDGIVECAQRAIGNIKGKSIQLADLKPFFKEWGIEHQRHYKKGRWWEFPPLPKIRAQWDEKFGKQDWSDTEEWAE